MVLDGRLDVAVNRDTVEFTFTIENAGTNPVRLKFQTGQTAEFTVHEDATEVWRWSDGRMFTQMRHTKTLEPTEAVDYQAAWPDPHPGEFTATATLTAIETAVEAHTAFTV